jgi:hypothetical protein
MLIQYRVSIMMNSNTIAVRRRLLIRAALTALWVGLGALLFVNFRGHSLLVDNHNLEDPAVRAPDLITVSVDGGKGLEFFRGDRDRFSVAGIDHRITVEFSDGRAAYEGHFKLPLGEDMYLLSVPKMINGITPFVEPFRSAPERRDSAEEELFPGDETLLLEEPGSLLGEI